MLLQSRRNSYVELGQIYFWTATINNWQRLLEGNEFKSIILASLLHLSNKGKMDVFAFVIMPNHIHLILRSNELNGKESPHASFLKYTAHRFKSLILEISPHILSNYKVKAINKNYEFWQRDPLAVPLYTKEVAFQKLDYIHANPVSPRWNLANDPCDYFYSSSRFYELGEKQFSFIKDLREEF